MGGYEAATAIRQQEVAGQRLPIIALTADVTDAGRERCLVAGMDDFVPKPLDRERLRDTLRRWLPDVPEQEVLEAEREPDSRQMPSGSSATTLELGTLRSLVGENRVKLRQYLDLFASTTGTLLEQIVAATSQRDAATLNRLAHTLKGACGNVGAHEMAALASALEGAASLEDWIAAAGFSRDLDSCFTRTKAAASAV